ncbi:hypothetical protein [Streptomyces lydicamycinicus]|uniref:Uncharacterized protein n=1 Tax=Streptomyces lydicamycinicus TaxID=1546107 RepID=A0A0P4RAS9_9ACTN|nr:hypothetical protein [Streptomyces lydicamycinicus]GAO09689.1 hypothetical protein TPA0598_05_04110 [Streptomyces lydicamycinicus]
MVARQADHVVYLSTDVADLADGAQAASFVCAPARRLGDARAPASDGPLTAPDRGRPAGNGGGVSRS